MTQAVERSGDSGRLPLPCPPGADPATWARMPEDARKLVLRCLESQQARSVELWANAQNYERHRDWRQEQRDEEAREAAEDALDESMLEKALDGQYGTRERDAANECVRQMVHGTRRRTFLRAARKAIQAARSERP